MHPDKLPEGYKFASEIPQKEREWEPQPPEAFERKRRKRDEPMQIESLREALEYFRRRVDATKLDDVMLGGMRVGAIFRRDSTDTKFLVCFKRAFYYHFSRDFMHVMEKGYGILSNIKLVHWAAIEGIRIAAVFPTGRCYWIDGREFWEYYEENETLCPHLEDEIASPLSKWQRLF